MANETELFKAIQSGDAARVQELLAEEPALVNARSPLGSAVLVAMYYGEPAIARLLVERGASLNLFEAAAVGATARIQELDKENPGQLNTFAPDGFTPLGLAAFFGHTDAVRWLLAHGADPNIASRNNQHVMPLHSAVAAKQHDISAMLLEAGAKVNAVQADGFTPLHEAAQNGQRDVVELLLAHGADRGAKKSDGKTPLDLALEYGYGGIVDLLRPPGT